MRKERQLTSGPERVNCGPAAEARFELLNIDQHAIFRLVACALGVDRDLPRAEQSGEILGNDPRDVALQRFGPLMIFDEGYLVGAGAQDELWTLDHIRKGYGSDGNLSPVFAGESGVERCFGAQRVVMDWRRAAAAGKPDDRQQDRQPADTINHFPPPLFPRIRASGLRSR